MELDQETLRRRLRNVRLLAFVIRNTFGKSMPKVTAFITAVRKEEDATLPISAAGFCWGGPHAVNLAYIAEAAGTGSRLYM
jgi:dienelactone hydrolase